MFVSTYYHCGVADHIRPNFYYFNLNDRNLYVAYRAKATKNCDGLKDASLADRFWCIAYQGKISPYICFAGAT